MRARLSSRLREPLAVNPPPFDTATTFVLVGTSHPGNVGAAARAIKVMGFSALVLVAPREAGMAAHPQALAMASGAGDVLAGAREVATLQEALAGATHVCATAMTPRDFGPPTTTPRAHLPLLAARGERVAFVFGPERVGLANADVYLAHTCLSIPTHPAYGSLNLAQAVQVLAYEWREALGGYPVTPRTAPPRWADGEALAGLRAHWQATLEDIGFLDAATPRKLMARLTQMANRWQLTAEEVHILRGIARAAGRGGRAPKIDQSGG